MSDLTDQRGDQQAPPNARIRPVNRLGRDRSLRFSDLAVTLFLLVGGCTRLPEPMKRDEVHRPELWVDAFSPPGGDGSSARPLKALPQPVPPGALVHLRSGLYPGPFVLGDGARLEGLGEVVLTGEAGQTVLTAAEASLDGVSVQGGAIGLEAGPGVVVTRASFSGQRKQAVVVHGQLSLSEARFEGSVEGIDGVVVDRGASLQLANARFTGGFRRAVMTEGGTLELQSVSAEGARTLVHALEATSRLAGLRSTLGSGPALFFAAGTVTMEDAEVSGHEYAVQLARGADARVGHLRAHGALQACVAASASTLRLSASSLAGCGPGGGLSLVRSQTSLTDVEITSARELGVFVSNGRLSLMGLRVAKVTGSGESLGDALHVRDEAQVSSLGGAIVFSDLEGSGLFVSSFAQVRLHGLTIERARSSALFVEREARVSIGALLVRGGGGPAVVVPSAASVELDSLSVAGGAEMPIYAECQAGAKVSVVRLESTVEQLPSQCVRR